MSWIASTLDWVVGFMAWITNRKHHMLVAYSYIPRYNSAPTKDINKNKFYNILYVNILAGTNYPTTVQPIG